MILILTALPTKSMRAQRFHYIYHIFYNYSKCMVQIHQIHPAAIKYLPVHVKWGKTRIHAETHSPARWRTTGCFTFCCRAYTRHGESQPLGGVTVFQAKE